MSGKIRQRTSANTEKAMNPMNTNERILRVRICIRIFRDIRCYKKPVCMYAGVIIKAYWYFTGMPSVVHGSRQWTMWDCQQSWLLPFGTKKENKHHAHWKPLGWKIFIHQLVRINFLRTIVQQKKEFFEVCIYSFFYK